MEIEYILYFVYYTKYISNEVQLLVNFLKYIFIFTFPSNTNLQLSLEGVESRPI